MSEIWVIEPAAHEKRYKFTVRSGDIGVGGGIVWGAGSSGFNWASRTSPSDTGFVYVFTFATPDLILQSSHHTGRSYGFPLRCLAS